jgi:LacI family transcriptional regulator
MKPDRVTLGKIAEEANVSRATVSRALRNNPQIPAATCRRVQRIARKLGYRPDPEARRLMTYLQQSKHRPFQSVIGLINDFADRASLRLDPYTVMLVEGARTRAEELGYVVDEIWTRAPGMTPTRLNQILRTRAVRGVLIPPEHEPLAAIHLDWNLVTAVATTTTAVPAEIHRVLPHNYLNMQTVMRRLHEMGYRRPGLVIAPDLELRQLHCPLAVYAWHWATVLNRKPPPHCVWEYGKGDSSRKRAARWLEKIQPDVVIGPDEWTLQYLEQDTGRRAPDDFGFVTYGNLHPGITGIDQRPAEVGSAAIDLLSAHIQRGETGLPTFTKTVQIEGRLVEGKTTSARSA